MQLHGSSKVGRFLAGIFAKERAGGSVRPVDVNGAPGALLCVDDRVVAVAVIRADEVLIVNDPEKIVGYV